MKIKLINVLLMASVFILSACGLQDAKSVRDTKDLYFTHVNKPAKLELININDIDVIDKTLASKFATLDRELTSLTRAMDSMLDPTKQNEVAKLLNAFPWLSNVYVLNAETDILGAIPAVAPAAISFSYLKDMKIKPREIYGHVMPLDGGANLLLARPYIQSGTLVGYLAVSFDPRSLLPFVGDASNIFIRTVNDVLWLGDSSFLVETDWAAVIDRRSFGSVSLLGATAKWFVRYYANIPIIFGIVE